MEDNRNYDATIKICDVLNNIKGFDVARSAPNTGKMLFKYNGTTFLMSISPVFLDTPKGNEMENRPFDDIVRDSKYLLK